ncbi:MAG TPA: DUF2934 domain-containing protein [Acetobacteraceae bacterium]|jgi:hypothetical protein
MSYPDRDVEQSVREAAYYIWESEGRPEGHAHDHWGRAIIATSPRDGEEPMEDEEKILAGRPDANLPALLTKDVPGG